MQLSKYIDLCAVSLSTAATNAVEVDTAPGCDGVLFIGIPATTAASTWNLALKMGATTTGFVSCSSTYTHSSTGAVNHVLVSDVYMPAKRWVGGTLGTTTATPNWLLAFKYGCRKLPITFSATAGLTATKCMSVVSPSSAT